MMNQILICGTEISWRLNLNDLRYPQYGSLIINCRYLSGLSVTTCGPVSMCCLFKFLLNPTSSPQISPTLLHHGHYLSEPCSPSPTLSDHISSGVEQVGRRGCGLEQRFPRWCFMPLKRRKCSGWRNNWTVCPNRILDLSQTYFSRSRHGGASSSTLISESTLTRLVYHIRLIVLGVCGFCS